MKFLRILAALLAVVLMCGSCLAEEGNALQTLIDGLIEEALSADADSDDDSDYVEYTATLLPELDFDLDGWLETSYMRSIFSVLLMVEMIDVEEYGIDGLIEEYYLPTVYLAGPAAGDYGAPIYAFYFFTDGSEGYSLNVIYSTSDGSYVGFVNEVYGDPSTYLDVFYEEGICGEYYEVSSDDFMTALTDLDEIINGD